MNAGTRLAVFAAGLLAVFAAAVGIGGAVGPVGPAADEVRPAAARSAEPGTEPAKGLAMSQDGYTLRLETPTLPPGQAAALAFTVDGPDGRPVTEYTPTHERDLHLIVVRRDLTGFQHVHPERDAAGRWSVPLTLPAPGVYRVFADFAPAGRSEALTLAADLHVPGEYRPVALPPTSRVATVDGYTVTLDGDLVAGSASALTLSVSRDGRPVTDLQPYLGAYGHLVVLRAGDLAYLHVHPDGEPGDGRTPAGPQVSFVAHVPTGGEYRLFLDFRHDGVVRTADFGAVASGDGAVGPGGSPAPGHADPHGH